MVTDALSSERGELRKKTAFLEASIDRLWQQLRQLLIFLMASLVCVLAVAPPSELHCDEAWMPLLLVFMAAGAQFISFIMLVRRLMQRYAELEGTKDQLELMEPTAQLAEGKNRAGRRGHRSGISYAVLAGLFFVIFTGSTAGISWWLACPEEWDDVDAGLLALWNKLFHVAEVGGKEKIVEDLHRSFCRGRQCG